MLPPVKKSSHLNQKRNMHRSRSVYKQNCPKPFFTGGSIIMDYGLLARTQGLKLKRLNDGFVSYKHSIAGLEWCGLLVDYCDVFISCLDSHSFFFFFFLFFPGPVSNTDNTWQCICVAMLSSFTAFFFFFFIFIIFFIFLLFFYFF